MCRLKLLFLFGLCVATLAEDSGQLSESPISDQAKNKTPPEPPTSVHPTSTSSTPKPTTKSTTPSSTTLSTTTTTPSTTSTTPSTTTTTPSTTPTPKPSPKPDEPKVNNWSLNYTDTNRTCLVMQAAIQLMVPVPNSNRSVIVNVPQNTTVDGDCVSGNNTEEILRVHWGNNSVLFSFKKNGSNYEMESIKTMLYISLNEGPKLYSFNHTKEEFEIPLKNSYMCARMQKLNLTASEPKVPVAYLHVSHLQFQAFRNTTNKAFDSAWDCDGINTPDLVPILIGCILAFLIVVILAVYLISRRRCQTRGYLSM